MKRVLIISPYFPPSNTADMHRIRMSLPYFREFGWKAEVVTVDPTYSEMVKDDLLLESIPNDIKIHYVKAFSKKWTGKFGLGSMALRAMYFYLKNVNRILSTNQFHLIYFSTTEFPLCILGTYWKRKFNIPYIIDMQDPWHSEYYKDKPKSERPKKYWFSYRLNKWLEPIAMKDVDGLISVSDSYIQTLKERYPHLKNIPTATITFGAFKKDVEIAEKHKAQLNMSLLKNENQFNVVYVGRGGHDMGKAVSLLFQGFKAWNQTANTKKSVHFYFIGTSYASAGLGEKTIEPLAKQFGIEGHVTEQTDRVSFYQALAYLNAADALFIPGSDDPAYTASKIYPYVLAEKPLLAIFNKNSSASEILKASKGGVAADLHNEPETLETVCRFFETMITSGWLQETDWNYFKQFDAKEMTKKQGGLFDQTLIANKK